MGSRPTIGDVARRAGTSTAVVSYVLNDGPRPVAEATRERVLEAIAELDYLPSRAARTMRKGISGFVGVLVPDLRIPFFSTLVHAIDRAAFASSEQSVVASSNWDPKVERQRAVALCAGGVDAIIVSAAAAGSDLRGLPGGKRLLFVHHRPEGHPGSHVRIDDEDAGRAAAQHLVDIGRRSIAVVTHAEPVGPVLQRLRGCEAAISAGGFPMTVVAAPCEREGTKEAVTAWLDEEGRGHDALVAVTDEQALGALAALQSAGRSVPDDVAVVTIDGTSETSTTTPAITAVVVPFTGLADRCFDALRRDKPMHTTVPARLVVRESTVVGSR